MSDRSITYADLWTWHKEAEDLPERRTEIIGILDLKKNLPNMKWQTQVEVLDNAPDKIIKACAALLKPEAKRKLGLEVKQPKTKEWQFTSLL